MPQVAYNQDPRYAQTPEAQQLTQATLSGEYLDEGNPYVDEVIANANRDTTQAFEGQLGNLSAASLAPGRLGSSVWSNQRRALGDNVAKRVADASTNLRGQVYDAERGRQNEVLGMSNQRDAGIWNDLTGRRGQDVQDRASARAASSARSGAAAQRYGAELAARAQEASTRSNLLLGQGRLAEEGRQFDAGMPLEWAQMLGGQINNFSGQNQNDLGLLGNFIGQQMGAQGNAAGMGADLGMGAAGLDLQGMAQQLQAAGMLPGFEQAGNMGMGMAGDFLGNLFSSQSGLDAARAAAGASRHATNSANQQYRDTMDYNSAQNQWEYNNPGNALNDFLGPLLGIGGLAGSTQTGRGRGGPSAGAVVPGQQSGIGSLFQTGLSAWLMGGMPGIGGG